MTRLDRLLASLRFATVSPFLLRVLETCLSRDYYVYIGFTKVHTLQHLKETMPSMLTQTSHTTPTPFS
jgi:hypothetical protein